MFFRWRRTFWRVGTALFSHRSPARQTQKRSSLRSQCLTCAPRRQAVAGSPEFSRAPVAPMLLQSARALSEYSKAPVATMLLQPTRALPCAYFFRSYLRRLTYWVSRWVSCQPLCLVPDVTSQQVQSSAPPPGQTRAMRDDRVFSAESGTSATQRC